VTLEVLLWFTEREKSFGDSFGGLVGREGDSCLGQMARGGLFGGWRLVVYDEWCLGVVFSSKCLFISCSLT